jgi:hypothetical protein
MVVGSPLRGQIYPLYSILFYLWQVKRRAQFSCQHLISDGTETKEKQKNKPTNNCRNIDDKTKQSLRVTPKW